jgi:hypothetical protein
MHTTLAVVTLAQLLLVCITPILYYRIGTVALPAAIVISVLFTLRTVLILKASSALLRDVTKEAKKAGRDRLTKVGGRVS